jgi:hypothetical protein
MRPAGRQGRQQIERYREGERYLVFSTSTRLLTAFHWQLRSLLGPKEKHFTMPSRIKISSPLSRHLPTTIYQAAAETRWKIYKLPFFALVFLFSFWLCVGFLSVTNISGSTTTSSSPARMMSEEGNSRTTSTSGHSPQGTPHPQPLPSPLVALSPSQSWDEKWIRTSTSSRTTTTDTRNIIQDNGYTLLLRPRECHRIDLIQHSIDHYARCSNVKQVQLVCNRNQQLLSNLVSARNSYYHPNMKLIQNITSFYTAATETVEGEKEPILLMEEHLFLSCHDIQNAYTIWRQHSDRMVGFFAYSMLPIKQSQNLRINGKSNIQNSSFVSKDYLEERKKEEEKEENMLFEETTKVGMGYSIISDRVAFLRKSYIVQMVPEQQEEFLFPSSVPTNFRASCRHLALSIRMTSVTGKPPLRVFFSKTSHPTQQSHQIMSDPYWKYVQKKKTELTRQQKNTSICVQSLLQTYKIQKLPVEQWSYTGRFSLDVFPDK